LDWPTVSLLKQGVVAAREGPTNLILTVVANPVDHSGICDTAPRAIESWLIYRAMGLVSYGFGPGTNPSPTTLALGF